MRVGDRSGRSYRIQGAATCIRSTVVDGPTLRPGAASTVRFFAREGIGSTTARALQTTRTLIARRWSERANRPPTCRTRRAGTLTTTSAFRFGVRAFARLQKATVRSAAVSCRPASKVGSVGRCFGSFQVKRSGRTVSYRLTARAGAFRNTPGSIEYRVYATADRRTAGLPSRASLLGFATARDV